MSAAAVLTKRSLVPAAKRTSNRYRDRDGKRDGGSRPAGNILAALYRLAAMILGLTFLTSLSLGLLAGYRFLTTSPFFDLRRIEISGIERVSEQEMLEASGLSLGQNSLSLNIFEVWEKLAAMPWVRDVTVRRVLPRTMQISVVERQAAFWLPQDDRLYYAEADGRAIAPVAPQKIVSRPVLLFEDGGEELSPLLQDFWASLNARDWPFSVNDVSWLRLSPKLGLEVALAEPRLVLRAALPDWRRGLADTIAVWDDLARRGELGRVSTVSAREGKVWVRLARPSQAHGREG